MGLLHKKQPCMIPFVFENLSKEYLSALGKQHLRVPCQRVSWNSSIFEPCVWHY